jgi:aminopeptidase
VRIAVGGADNTRSLTNVDPARIVLHQQARSELMKIFMHRSAAGELRWTYVVFPTNAYAQDAEMSLGDYEDFVYGACLPDMNDPVGYWQRFSKRQQKVVDWLKGKEWLRVTGPETDLRVGIRTTIHQLRWPSTCPMAGIHRAGGGQREGHLLLIQPSTEGVKS